MAQNVGGERTDETLMLAYRNGDEDAFQIVFQRYSGPLLKMFRAHGIDDAGAQDLVQQTFLQLHRARNDYHVDAPLRPWLYTIAANTRRQFFRRGFRKPETSLESAPEPSTTTVSALDAKHDIHRALAAISTDLVEVIALHWFGGLTFPEIAQVLGIGVPAAKGRAHRGYLALRQHLAPEKDS